SGARDEHRREDEDGGEAEDEEERAEDHATTPALLEGDVGEPGDVTEVPRDEREHARGGEGDEPGEGGDEQGEGQGPVRDLVAQPAGERRQRSAHPRSARVSSTTPTSVFVVTGPRTTAATRP